MCATAWHTCAMFAFCVLPQFAPCVPLRGTHAPCLPPACCPSLRHVCHCVAHMCRAARRAPRRTARGAPHCALPQFAPCVPLRGTHAPCLPPACCPSLRHVCHCVAHMRHVCLLRAAPVCAMCATAWHTCAMSATCVLPQFAPCVPLRGTHVPCLPPACCPSLSHVCHCVAHMCHVCQEGPRGSQDGPRGSKRPPSSSKMPPRRPKMAATTNRRRQIDDDDDESTTTN